MTGGVGGDGVGRGVHVVGWHGGIHGVAGMGAYMVLVEMGEYMVEGWWGGKGQQPGPWNSSHGQPCEELAWSGGQAV